MHGPMDVEFTAHIFIKLSLDYFGHLLFRISAKSEKHYVEETFKN